MDKEIVVNERFARTAIGEIMLRNEQLKKIHKEEDDLAVKQEAEMGYFRRIEENIINDVLKMSEEEAKEKLLEEEKKARKSQIEKNLVKIERSGILKQERNIFAFDLYS